MATQPFVWGGGGRRLTPEQIAQQRAIAQQQMQTGMDYSPIGHWSQGLSRVAQGLLGGLEMRNLAEQEAQNAEENRRVIGSLLGGMTSAEPTSRDNLISSVSDILAEHGIESALPAAAQGSAAPAAQGINPSLISALSSPYADPQTRQVAMALLQQEMQRGDPLYQAQVQKAAAEARAKADPNANLPDSVRALKIRAAEAGLVPGTPEYRRFMAAGGRSENESARAQQIERLAANLFRTGAAASEQDARDRAEAIVDGRFTTSRDPLTGELQIVDMGRFGVSGSGSPAVFGRGAEGAPVPQPMPQSSPAFGTPFEAGSRAFGVEGAAIGALNRVADTLGLAPIDQQVQQTQADFSLLGENLLNDVSQAYSRQPPSWLLKEIRELMPRAGSPFEGAGAARSKLRTLGRHFENERAAAEAALQRRLSPEMRQATEQRLMGLDYALARLNAALDSMEGGQRQPTAPASPEAPPPAGVSAEDWQFMTPEERALWR